MQHLVQQNEELKLQISRINDDTAELEHLKNEIEKDKQLIDQHEITIKLFESKIVELSATNKQLEEKLTDVTGCLTIEKALESDSEKEIEKWIQNLTAAETTNFERQIEWTDREKSITEEMNVLKEQVDHLTSDNDTLNMKLNESQSAMESLKSENEIELNSTKLLNLEITNLLTTKDDELEKTHIINADLQQKVALLEQKCGQVIFGFSFIDL